MAKLESSDPKNLYLGYSSVTTDLLPEVLRFMRVNRTEILDLRHNTVTADGLLKIAHGLQHDRLHLTKLGLKTNVTGQDDNLRGLTALADALTTNTKLKSIDLRANRISDKACALFRKVLAKNKHLVKINLGANPQIADTGGRQLVAGMIHNYFIKDLQLDGTSISQRMQEKIER